MHLIRSTTGQLFELAIGGGAPVEGLVVWAGRSGDLEVPWSDLDVLKSEPWRIRSSYCQGWSS